MEAWEGGGEGLDLGYAVEVADGVLGEALGPAAQDVEGGDGELAEVSFEFGEGEGGDFGVWQGGDCRSVFATEESSEEPAVFGGSAGVFLVGEGGGEELAGLAGGDEEAEAFGDVEVLGKGEDDRDGRGGFEGVELG